MNAASLVPRDPLKLLHTTVILKMSRYRVTLTSNGKSEILPSFSEY